jgi:hypothetical protein
MLRAMRLADCDTIERAMRAPLRFRHGTVRGSRGTLMMIYAPGMEKGGKTCAESILALIAHGDASVRAAKANGRIEGLTSVDHSARSFFPDSRHVVHARVREMARQVPVVARPWHAPR